MPIPTSPKKPRRRFRKFNKKKAEKLLAQAPKFFVFQGSARYDFNGEIKVLEPDVHLNIGKYGRYKLVNFNGATAIIMHSARRKKDDKLIRIRARNVAIGHGMFVKQSQD